MNENIGVYVDMKILCEALHLSKSGIIQLCKRGKFPKPIKIGGANRWSVRSIEEFLQAKEVSQC